MSSIISTVNLVQAGDRWTFSSEAELENFLWNNLHILGLTPLKKQYFISGQYCDILAVDSNSQLVIIELKNTEDRYIVQQLTRYYDALLQERTLDEAIDYSKPPRLMAICPSFHRDNLIDRRYHKLEIDFLRFEILFRDDKFIFVLKDIDSNKTLETYVSYNLPKPNINISQPPRKLLNHIYSLSEEKQKGILDIRTQILGFDERIKEIVSGSHIFYGKTEKFLCAEFFISPTFKSIELFLWLPHPTRKRICRMAIATKDFALVDSFDYSSKGTKHNEAVNIPGYSGIYNCWQDPALMIRWIETSKYDYWAYAANNYAKLMSCPERANSLELLVEIALDKWLEKVSPKPAKLLEEVPVLK